MTVIKHAVLPKTELGNDPNDNRHDPNYLAKAKIVTPIDWTKDFILSDEELMEIADPEWVYPNLIIKGHIVVFPAPPNGGKTTLLLWIAGQIASSYQVCYVNADVSASDAKSMGLEANKRGFKLLLPDLKQGLCVDDVVLYLEQMNAEVDDLSEFIFFFDTLKKMLDLMSKKQAATIFKLFRGLTGKGMTIVLLAHTNKHKGEDGKHVFEGTGDIRSDCDDMIYLESQKYPDGSMTISTIPDKQRGDFKPLTFDVARDRQVLPQDEYKDIRTDNQKRQQREKDEEVIEMIKEAIANGQINQGHIVKYCKDSGFSAGRIRTVLTRYSTSDPRIWYAKRGEKNSWLYELI